MARTFAVAGDQTVTTGTDTALTLESLTTIRPEVYWCVFGCTSDAIDFMIRWSVQRFSVDDGAGTAVIPNPRNDGDPASGVKVISNHTTEPNTYTAAEIVLDMTVNTRAPQQWHAHDRDDRIVLAAVASEGIGFQPIHGSSTAGVIVQMAYEE